MHASPKQGCRYSRPPVATHMFFKKQLCHGGRNEDLYITCFDPCTYKNAIRKDEDALSDCFKKGHQHKTCATVDSFQDIAVQNKGFKWQQSAEFTIESKLS